MTELTTDRETLRKAADILQSAHDLIEAVGFDIDTYSGLSGDDGDPMESRKVEAPMCYIGSIRYAAGVEPDPNDPEPYTTTNDDASVYQGSPELKQALAVLDELAKQQWTDIVAEDPELFAECVQEWRDPFKKYQDVIATGRFVESFGFLIKHKVQRELMPPEPQFVDYRHLDDHGIDCIDWATYHDAHGDWLDESNEHQKAYALGILRQALSEIHQAGE